MIFTHPKEKNQKQSRGEEATTYLFNGLRREHEWMLFLHADAILDPHVQASEMGRVAGRVGNVETSALFILEFNSRFGWLQRKLRRGRGLFATKVQERGTIERDREGRGRTALQSRIDRLATRCGVIAPGYREHRGRCSGLGDAEKGFRFPVATVSIPTVAKKRDWKSKSRKANPA